MYLPCDQGLSARPISIWKAQSRKEKPISILWISPKTCLSCLIIIQSCYYSGRVAPSHKMGSVFLNLPHVVRWAYCSYSVSFLPSVSTIYQVSIGVCLLSQSASEKHMQSRKKAHKPLCILWISPKTCLSCLVIIQSCYCLPAQAIKWAQWFLFFYFGVADFMAWRHVLCCLLITC